MSSARQKLAGAVGLAVAATGLSIVASPAAHAAPVTIRLLNINDFHGRIDSNTTKVATTIERLRAQAGEPNTLFLSAGDNIGASVFASAVQQDAPTLDVLDALDLATSAVGNHEFDGGWADLDGRVADRADFEYLGANVYQKGTTTPVLPEYETFQVAGVTVGVIGAVTQDTPTLVTPAGIANLDFGDPVAAVNRVAAQLSDGQAGNGEADVIVAEYHEGAQSGEADATLEQEVAKATAFSRIVTETVAAVDVIFTGHSHKDYTWDGPVPGQPGETRPILQAGNYGGLVGRVDLTVEADTGEVTAYSQENVARDAAEDLSYERVQEVKEIVDTALAEAAEVGNQPVGSIKADITTALPNPALPPAESGSNANRDDRKSESTLGALVANALRDGVPASAGDADLGIVNSGGLRAELLYAGNTASNPANTDGVVTYAEANNVLPFVNNVWLVDLLGADLKYLLEQQWPGVGSSRTSMLNLGLSDNVVATYDETKPAGSRITSLSIDGAPIDPAATYTVSTFSFLATGGDNFSAFTRGTTRDTGLVDRDLWIQYLRDHPGLAPDFARQQVGESGMPTTVKAGEAVNFALSKLDLTSAGSPKNTTVVATGVRKDGTSVPVGSFAVTNGAATIKATIPHALFDGVLKLVAQPSGTTVTIPVAAGPRPAVGVVVKAPKAKGKKNKVSFTLTANGKPVTGTLLVQVRNKVIETQVVNGVGTVKLGKKVDRFAKKGKVKATLVFTGSAEVMPFETTTKFTVKKKRK